MSGLHIEPDAYQAFQDDPYEGPICQINLLTYHKIAQYKEGEPEAAEGPISGRDAYHRYAHPFQRVAESNGGRCLMMGSVERTLIGDSNFDEAMIMFFPSRHAFLATVGHENYRDIHRHRRAGLKEQDLITTRPELIGDLVVDKT